MFFCFFNSARLFEKIFSQKLRCLKSATWGKKISSFLLNDKFSGFSGFSGFSRFSGLSDFTGFSGLSGLVPQN